MHVRLDLYIVTVSLDRQKDIDWNSKIQLIYFFSSESNLFI